MITNEDVFNALKTLQVFCNDNKYCENCPFEKNAGCFFHDMIQEAARINGTYAPAVWDVERYCRPLLDN